MHTQRLSHNSPDINFNITHGNVIIYLFISSSYHKNALQPEPIVFAIFLNHYGICNAYQNLKNCLIIFNELFSSKNETLNKTQRRSASRVDDDSSIAYNILWRVAVSRPISLPYLTFSARSNCSASPLSATTSTFRVISLDAGTRSHGPR